jgi:hypothetical protein
MGSLFNNGSCCGNTAGTFEKSKCNSCVCELLNNLANAGSGDFCRLGQPTLIRVIPKGSEEPLDVNASEFGTDFTLVRFDPKTCCVILSYTEGIAPNGITRTIVLDCRCICGIVCIPNVPLTAPVL